MHEGFFLHLLIQFPSNKLHSPRLLDWIGDGSTESVEGRLRVLNQGCYEDLILPGGEDQVLLEKRHALYEKMREKHPSQWSRDNWNWSMTGATSLNPQKEQQAAWRFTRQPSWNVPRLSKLLSCAFNIDIWKKQPVVW